MRIFRHFNDVPDASKGAVVTLGNFDGVHLGHQALIGEARRLAQERGVQLGVVAFEPHPQEFFHPSAESFRLTPFRTKARLIAELKADILYAIAFDADMAAKSAHEFVHDVLVRGLGVNAIVVGEDFQFGKARAGNIALLETMGKEANFAVNVFKPVAASGHDKISSPQLRDALKEGKPEIAARLLGHHWSVEARVEHGDKRGRTIGFPTATMKLVDCLKPAYGIYAVRAKVLEDDKIVSQHEGVSSFGIRPMFQVETPLLETYLFDFSGDLYGKHLAVELIAYLRPEVKLDGLDALKAQIAKDSDDARKVLRSISP
jgi:riboflavin kinase/FMN adenylyltransferase